MLALIGISTFFCISKRHSRRLRFRYIAWNSNSLDSSNERSKNILYTHTCTTTLFHKKSFTKFNCFYIFYVFYIFIYFWIFIYFIFLFMFIYSFLYIYFLYFIYIYFIFLCIFKVFNFSLYFKGFIQTVFREQFSVTRY